MRVKTEIQTTELGSSVTNVDKVNNFTLLSVFLSSEHTGLDLQMGALTWEVGAPSLNP